MEELDLKLKLLGGLPIVARMYGSISPLTVKEVLSFGYTEYLKCLNLVCLEKRDFFKDVSDEELKDLSMLEFFIHSKDSQIISQLEESLSLFLGGESYVDTEELCVYIKKNEKDVRVVNGSNYEEIVEVLKWQNYIKHFKEDTKQEAPMDEKARAFKEKVQALNKKVNDIKKKRQSLNNEDSLDFYDIISSLSSKSYSINELNIIDLTIYQVYSKFKRLDILDKYEINIKSMLAGAKDIQLKHWSSKLD